MKAYIILVAGWLVYLSLHSILASEKIKARFRGKGYRLFYSLLSIGGLLALLFFNGRIHAPMLFSSEGWVRYASLMLTTFGVMIIQVTFKQYSLKAFLGLSEEESGLKTTGILQYVRHPIYSGTILIIIGFFLFIPNLPTLISCVCMLLYLPVGMYLEEKKLDAAFGDLYRTYKKRVPSLIPRIK